MRTLQQRASDRPTAKAKRTRSTARGVGASQNVFPACVSKYVAPISPGLLAHVHLRLVSWHVPCFARNTKQVPHGASCATDCVSNLTNSNAWPCARCSNGPRTGRLPKQSELAQRGVSVPARTYLLSVCRRSQPGYPAPRRDPAPRRTRDAVPSRASQRLAVCFSFLFLINSFLLFLTLCTLLNTSKHFAKNVSTFIFCSLFDGSAALGFPKKIQRQGTSSLTPC